MKKKKRMKKEMKKEQRREVLVGVRWEEEGGCGEEGWRGFNPSSTNPMTKQCPPDRQSGTVDSETLVWFRQGSVRQKPLLVQNKGQRWGR